ncbi:zinc-dependent alcohol dehydrogenase family protein [Roseibium sp.]|uniref:zinc-dependent alcohol dehydrogenase family protein n=1 Tax=Roseibium sp. TaxID=1936156 RepID=UPI003B519EFA
MQSWSFKEGFGLDNLVKTDEVMPEVGPRDVLLEMHAASLNYRDLVVMQGGHGRTVAPPLVPLSDGVGKIIATGRQVADFAVGDRVCPAFYQHWYGGAPPANLDKGRLGGPLDGVLATHRVFAAETLVRIPEYLSDAEATALPCAGVTAWSALNEPTSLRSGETVLVQGTGGVALMALQLAKAMGARVIMTTSTPAKAKQLRELGADDVIDRSKVSNWHHLVQEMTEGRGVDRVLELGGATTLNTSVKSVKTGGTVLLIGNVTGNVAELFLPLLLSRRITLHAVSVGSQETFRSLCKVLQFHRIRPVIGKLFDFDDALLAFGALESGEVFGKVCVSCQPDRNK